jgi:type IV secretory pathway VirB10-like protein
MNNRSPNTKTDLTPQPQLTKINGLAFIIICAVIVMIVLVLAYSVSQATKNKTKSDIIPISSSATINDQELWYKNVSDELPTKASSIASEVIQDESPVDKEMLKNRDELLRSALESPIKAPNISNSPSLNSLNETTSQTGAQSSADNSGISQELKGNENNTQKERLEFLQLAAHHSTPDYLYSMVKKPLSPYEIKAGTVIPAVLIGGIDSDLPGQLTALVSKNVFDTVSGRYLLIPQGSRLILQYDSQIVYGQERLLVATKRLIFPNGSSLDLKGMPVTDERGYAGLYDQVDRHYLRIFGSSGLMGLIIGGFALSQNSGSVNNPSSMQVMDGALGQQMGQVTLGMINKNLEIQPTIKIRPGLEFNVNVTSDLIFPGSY